MRSVVVVLPASMWAMIPMLRVFSSETLRGIKKGPVRAHCIEAFGPEGDYVVEVSIDVGN